jgi:ferritin-like metal-binding protein YciE
MFETLTTAEEISSFALGGALTMERTTLETLGDLEDHAQRDDLKRLFREHGGETQQHVANIERAFQMLGEDVDDSPCPAIQGQCRNGAAGGSISPLSSPAAGRSSSGSGGGRGSFSDII